MYSILSFISISKAITPLLVVFQLSTKELLFSSLPENNREKAKKDLRFEKKLDFKVTISPVSLKADASCLGRIVDATGFFSRATNYTHCILARQRAHISHLNFFFSIKDILSSNKKINKK